MAEANKTPSNDSEFLKCLSKLDLDTWAEQLLPKLVEAGSAGNVALACKQLRDLCFHSRRELNLRSLNSIDSPSTMEQWAGLLPRHFPNCSSVQLGCADSLYMMTFLLPALHQLPSLRDIQLDISGQVSSTAVSTVLYSMRKVTGLQTLSVKLHQQLSSPAWKELGGLAQLTALHVYCDPEVSQLCRNDDFALLSGLGSLQELVIRTPEVEAAEQQPLSDQLLKGLTALTWLECTCTVDLVPCVRSCTTLQGLCLKSPEGRERELCSDAWQAIGRPTSLTELCLWSAKITIASPACCAALGQLTQLGFIRSERWSPSLVPALAACTQLTGWGGAWVAAADGLSNSAHAAFPGVVYLGTVRGRVPFKCFPNLSYLEQYGSVPVNCWEAMCHHCKGLTAITISSNDVIRDHASLDTAAPLQQRLDAIQAMVSLTQLRELEFMVHDKFELAALVGVVQQLTAHQLTFFETIFNGDEEGEFTAGSFMPLAQLQGLKKLRLTFGVDALDALIDDGPVFLCSLSHIPVCSVVVPSDELATTFNGIADTVREMGLPLPQQLRIYH